MNASNIKSYIIVYKIIYAHRNSPEVFTKKDAPQTRNKHKGEQPPRMRTQQSRFTISLKPHTRTDVPPRIRSAPAEHLYPGVHL